MKKYFDSIDSRQVITSITAGLVAGLIVIVFCISLATLIFSGEMSAYVSRGIGLFLFGGFAMSVMISIFGSLPGTAIGPQDGPAALLAVAASGIVAALVGTVDSDSLFATIVAAMILCSFTTGLIFFLIGTFKRDLLFDPFVTTKREGRGLGLALVAKLTRDMGGAVHHSRDADWTHFRLHLPAASTADTNGTQA